MTAVEWLEEFMNNGKQKSEGIISLAFAKAKEMEFQQMKKSYYTGCASELFDCFEKYYNETYGTDK